MYGVDNLYSFRQTERVIDLAVALVDYTDSIEQCGKIPHVLGRALNISYIMLAVVRLPKENSEPQFVICCDSGHLSASENDFALRQKVRRIYLQLLPLLKNDIQSPCQSFHARHPDHPFSDNFSIPARVMVFTRMIDASHRMLLIVQGRISDAGIAMDLADNLCIIAHELSKQLRCPIAYCNSSFALGPPFNQLVEQEWRVLLGLNSELSEKQLAIQLGLSPHTLHSHIKSIYRKVQVQGRLPLLLRLHSAFRRMRMDAHKIQSKSRSF